MSASAFLPTSVEEMRARGWDQPDVVFGVGRFEDDCTSTVPKDDADVAARGADIETGRMHLRADHEDPLISSGADQRVRHLEREKESAALRAKVDARRIAGVDGLVQKE